MISIAKGLSRSLVQIQIVTNPSECSENDYV